MPLVSSFAVAIAIAAHPQKADTLRAAIVRADSSLFARFNAHDLPGTMRWFTSDVEFYHDGGGLQHLADVEAGFKGNFVQNNGLRRDLVPESLEVYPVPGYGAIEVGRHRFCHREGARTDCGEFKFVQVWRRTADGWKLARVVSFGH